ncbi:enoyl-CoA hydratase-related protein [Frankia sp. AgW1.1]|uniref:enoyl-CoA hydratase/isomerase family protein n=1 Tax=Frankia sp. AgW1.1 TaxID=1836971 RepID=UPI0027DB5147|nr:enoyl-CoA hydratase-related protein [Frankia sp. AgW1.1]
MDEVLLTSTVGRVRLLTLNRPRQANAFSSALYLATADALIEAATDDGVGALVLTGAGRSFSAGTDLVEMAAQAQATAAGRPTETGQDPATSAGGAGAGSFNAIMDALIAFPKPLLAAVNGAGVGLGLTMLAHCDIVFIAEGARLLAPFTAMGVAPEAGSSYLLPRRMGRQRAARALLASEWISAAEAVDVGLALAAYPAQTLLAETLALATTIADRPLASILATTRLIRAAERAGVEQARQAENAAFAELLRRPDLGGDILRRLDPTSRDEATDGES